jgi:hypothetical protein
LARYIAVVPPSHLKGPLLQCTRPFLQVEGKWGVYTSLLVPCPGQGYKDCSSCIKCYHQSLGFTTTPLASDLYLSALYLSKLSSLSRGRLSGPGPQTPSPEGPQALDCAVASDGCNAQCISSRDKGSSGPATSPQAPGPRRTARYMHAHFNASGGSDPCARQCSLARPSDKKGGFWDRLARDRAASAQT